MGRLDGKVAIVTGAARGTGATTALLLAAEGAKVVLGDVLDERGESVAKEIGSSAVYTHLDITQEEDWRNAIEIAVRLGPLNVLVNNAAVLHVAPIEETSADQYMRVVTVNEFGTFLGVRSVIQPMRETGGGRDPRELDQPRSREPEDGGAFPAAGGHGGAACAEGFRRAGRTWRHARGRRLGRRVPRLGREQLLQRGRPPPGRWDYRRVRAAGRHSGDLRDLEGETGRWSGQEIP